MRNLFLTAFVLTTAACTEEGDSYYEYNTFYDVEDIEDTGDEIDLIELETDPAEEPQTKPCVSNANELAPIPICGQAYTLMYCLSYPIDRTFCAGEEIPFQVTILAHQDTEIGAINLVLNNGSGDPAWVHAAYNSIFGALYIDGALLPDPSAHYTNSGTGILYSWGNEDVMSDFPMENSWVYSDSLGDASFMLAYEARTFTVTFRTQNTNAKELWGGLNMAWYDGSWKSTDLSAIGRSAHFTRID